MITGAHTIIYSTNAEADREFLRDVLAFPHVDVGHGWLIFGLPPSEVAVHPSDENDKHEFYLICDDIQTVIDALQARQIECSPVHEERWGSLIQVTLPGGGKLGLYQPKHARPPTVMAKKKPARKTSAKKAKRPAAKKRGKRGSERRS